MRQGHVVVVLTDVGAREQRGEGLVGQPLGGDRRHATKVVAGERGKLVVIDRAGGSQHHAGRSVVRLHVLHNVVGHNGVDVLRGPENRACQRGSHVGNLVQAVEDHLLDLALNLLHLAENHVALAFDRSLRRVAREDGGSSGVGGSGGGGKCCGWVAVLVGEGCKRGGLGVVGR